MKAARRRVPGCGNGFPRCSCWRSGCSRARWAQTCWVTPAWAPCTARRRCKARTPPCFSTRCCACWTGLIVITLRVRPVSASRIAQTHRDEVQAQVNAIFRLGALFLWLRSTRSNRCNFTLRSTRAVVDLLSAEHKLGTISLSLGSLLGFALAIWLSLLISRVLRFFLSEEVYERVQLAPGLPYAISTILNYLILLVGFIIALGAAGRRSDEDHHRRRGVLGGPGFRTAKHHQQFRVGHHPVVRASGEGRRRDPVRRFHRARSGASASAPASSARARGRTSSCPTAT